MRGMSLHFISQLCLIATGRVRRLGRRRAHGAAAEEEEVWFYSRTSGVCLMCVLCVRARVCAHACVLCACVSCSATLGSTCARLCCVCLCFVCVFGCSETSRLNPGLDPGVSDDQNLPLKLWIAILDARYGVLVAGSILDARSGDLFAFSWGVQSCTVSYSPCTVRFLQKKTYSFSSDAHEIWRKWLFSSDLNCLVHLNLGSDESFRA